MMRIYFFPNRLNAYMNYTFGFEQFKLYSKASIEMWVKSMMNENLIMANFEYFSQTDSECTLVAEWLLPEI